MSTTEWALLALVILIPAIVATGVTLWTLEQALKRNKKNRRQAEVKRSAREGAPATEASTEDFGR
jgi:hypothetical protein